MARRSDRSLPLDALDVVEVGPQRPHLAQDRADHAGRTQCRHPAGPGEVVDAHLHDLVAQAGRPDDEFGVDERALALQVDVVEDAGPDELEREVDVADLHPEQGLDQPVVRPRVDGPERSLARPVEPVGADDVSYTHLTLPTIYSV